jgi:NADPH:quinone reductase-like Zn-dependent oxidoreductase
MKAVLCPGYGPPEVLRIADIAKPTPKDNEVLIKVRASTVTVADVRIRAFNVPKSYWIPARLALGITKPRSAILGSEFAGVVESIGSRITKFKPGDEVLGSTFPQLGGYAEYKTAGENSLTAKPRNITFEEAAAIPVGALTADHFLKRAGIRSGHKVLIYGASGSVGTYAVQMANHFGAKVTGICSGKNASLVKSLGAEKVIPYDEGDFSSRLEKYDIIMVAIDKIPFAVCRKAMTERGVYLNVTMPFRSPEMMITSMTSNKKVIVGEGPTVAAEQLRSVTGLVASGHVKVVIDRSYPLEQIVEAHRYVDSGRKKGNVVVKVS